MKKKRMCKVAGLLILMMLLNGCINADNTLVLKGDGQSGANTEAVNETDTEITVSEIETEQTPVKIKTPIRDLDEAYNVILNYCTRDFIGGHPIDETFLGWVHALYGEEAVEHLADIVASGEQDVNAWYEVTGNTMHVLWLMYCQDTGMNQDELENVYWKECASTEQTVLDFSGDINFSEGWGTMRHLDSQPNGIYDCFSPDLLEEMQAADITMINNEFTYSTRGTPLEGKTYTFRANPERAKLLEVFGTDIVSLANNHVCDYGDEALIDTLETLVSNDIPYVGAGRNIDEAKEIVYFIANGRKIAITAATQIERSLNYTKEATEDTPGVLKTLNSDKYVEVLKEAEKNSDIVIAFVHWGTEHESRYGADQKNLAEDFVEAGADVIIGGHTHCLQGITYMEGVPIIYSLGNFWFNQNTLDTGLSQVIIKKDGSIDFRFLPCIQKNYKTSLVTDVTEKQRILDYMESISDEIGIDEDGFITDLSQED